jgi:xanthine dehydrogenase YagS FAD-binding subunit
MQPFTFERATSVDGALAAMTSARRTNDAMFVAGGTELLNWLKEGIAAPAHLVDINALPLGEVRVDADAVRLGALSRMSDVAADPHVRAECPAVAEALELSASPQIRNMASMAGNLMQRTRCPYFRAEVPLPCNKRVPGSGCSALQGENRSHAIFGWTDACVATHASDAAVALAALDATIAIRGPAGTRTIPLLDLYRLPEVRRAGDTTLAPGELIVEIAVPRSPLARASRYIKGRERASYEFALVSAAAAVTLEGGRIAGARIALGAVAHTPWRLRRAEQALAGRTLDRDGLLDAVRLDFDEARPLRHNGFKITLAQRVAVRALELAGGRE